MAGLFAEVRWVNAVFHAKFKIIPLDAVVAAWMLNGDMDETTHELVGHLEVAMVATARGSDSAKASLLTWPRRLGQPMFKTVMTSAHDRASGIVIMDLPAKVPGLDGCAACVAAKSVHLPHKEGHSQAKVYLDSMHVDLVGPMPAKSVGVQEYKYIAVGDYLCTVYARPMHLKSETLTYSRHSRQQWKTNLEGRCAR
jgi:hypothetical protein